MRARLLKTDSVVSLCFCSTFANANDEGRTACLRLYDSAPEPDKYHGQGMKIEGTRPRGLHSGKRAGGRSNYTSLGPNRFEPPWVSPSFTDKPLSASGANAPSESNDHGVSAVSGMENTGLGLLPGTVFRSGPEVLPKAILTN